MMMSLVILSSSTFSYFCFRDRRHSALLERGIDGHASAVQEPLAWVCQIRHQRRQLAATSRTTNSRTNRLRLHTDTQVQPAKECSLHHPHPLTYSPARPTAQTASQYSAQSHHTPPWYGNNCGTRASAPTRTPQTKAHAAAADA